MTGRNPVISSDLVSDEGRILFGGLEVATANDEEVVFDALTPVSVVGPIRVLDVAVIRARGGGFFTGICGGLPYEDEIFTASPLGGFVLGAGGSVGLALDVLVMDTTETARIEDVEVTYHRPGGQERFVQVFTYTAEYLGSPRSRRVDGRTACARDA